MHFFVEPAGNRTQNTCRFQYGHGHEDTEEEENRGHVDARDDLRDTVFFGFFEHFVVVHDFGENPQDTQHEENADERRHVGDGLEYGHEDETAHTEEEDGFLLSRRNEVAAGDDAVSFGQFAFELPGHEEQRNDKGGHTRQEYIGHQGGGSHVAIDPKHDGGHVTDGRPGAAGIGCDDNHTGVNPAFVLVVDEFAQQHDHHDGGREVVENR